jgi:hypothetical protein
LGETEEDNYILKSDVIPIHITTFGQLLKDEAVIWHELVAKENKKISLHYIEWKSRRVRRHRNY